jgi:membrane fusion protein (multidrug efflux system)
MKLASLPRTALFALIFAVTGCEEASKSGAGGPPQAPVQVGVVTLAQQAVTLTTDLPGRTSAYRIADVRPQVNGVLQKRLFVEGDEVQAGQQLYQIDPALYQAAYDSALAMLAHANAEMASAKALADRYKALGASNAVSKQDYDNAVASQLQAQADVESGQAAVETAHINLVYTKVLSPITGRTGISVTEGALVTANQSTPLVTVRQLDPIYVDIPQSMALLLRLRRELESGQIKSSGKNQAQINLTLEDGSTYDQPGQLQFTETTVDESTGSVTLRAIFPNPHEILLPGMFVTARLEEGVNDSAILVPQLAVTHNAKGDPIKTDRAIRDQWLVTDGLRAGDRVIVDGLQRAQPGAKVVPTDVTPPTSTAQQ